LSYAGRPVSVWREGRRQTVTGWGKMAGVTVPGLGKRYRSPVATADWHILSSRFAVTTRVAFYAGLGARLEHFGLVALAWLAARGWTGDLKPMAGLLMQGRRLTRRFASDAGAMTVDVSGIDGEGAQAVAHWWLIAERGDGPKVPVLAAMALTRRLLDGDFHVGARMAAGAASLAEIEAEMHAFALRTDRNVETAAPITPENARVGA
ncbi:MAG: saccharopine dehydrogenase, partial [Hyphomicrobium sp.]